MNDDDLPLYCYPDRPSDWTFDSKAFEKSVDSIARLKDRWERREERKRIAKALAIIEAAKKSGLPVKAATIEGVELQFGSTPSNEEVENRPSATLNEWDQDLGTHPPQARQ
jgi:hypothetical protein